MSQGRQKSIIFSVRQEEGMDQSFQTDKEASIDILMNKICDPLNRSRLDESIIFNRGLSHEKREDHFSLSRTSQSTHDSKLQPRILDTFSQIRGILNEEKKQKELKITAPSLMMRKNKSEMIQLTKTESFFLRNIGNYLGSNFQKNESIEETSSVIIVQENNEQNKKEDIDEEIFICEEKSQQQQPNTKDKKEEKDVQHESTFLQISYNVKDSTRSQINPRDKRTNSCFKKKTLIFKQADDKQSAYQGNMLKSNKKVIFDQDQYKEQARIQQPNVTSRFGSKKTQSYESKGSVTSIFIQENHEGLQRSALSNTKKYVTQSTKTLYDLGDRNIVYRLKKSNTNEKEKACQTFELSQEEEIREYCIFQIVKKLKHSNIITFYEMTKELSPDSKRFIIQLTMDFYPKNLKQYLLEVEQSNIPQRQRMIQRKIILFKIIKGLNFLHQNKIYHRNINPCNIYLNNKLDVVIANFSSMDSHKMAMKSLYKSDWSIRPPQIILNPDYKFNQGGDIWGLGCLIVYMLKQNMPFEEYSDSNMIVEISKCTGRITQEDLKSIEYKNSKRFIFPKMCKESMTKMFNCQDKQLLEVLKKIFVFNPSKRISSSELLNSPYFNQLRSQSFKRQHGGCVGDLFDAGEVQLDTKKSYKMASTCQR